MPPAVWMQSTGRVAVLRESAADRLGERREDRVLQFGQNEADEPGALAAQLGRALVAEHVEGGEHGLARGGARRPACRSARG